jgi:hypothetical protein
MKSVSGLRVSAAFVLFATVLVNLPQTANSAKILSIAFFSSKSHKITYEPLLNELATRGHEVTVLAPVTFGSKKIREIMTFDAMKMFAEDGMPNMFELKEESSTMDPRMFLELITKVCNITYDLPHVKALLKESFDMVMVPAIFNECAFGYAYKFNAPILLISPAMPPTWSSSILGTPSPPSFVANPFTPYSDRMTFYQRGVNLFVETLIQGLQMFYFKPAMAALYREKLNDPTLPSCDEIISERASIMLCNSHFSLAQTRPLLPDVIEVGGMHCRPAKPLPKDLEDFVSSSGNDGFILFSMGSALKGSMMPEKQRKIFLGAFARLKQKVLWKWETETMPDLPKNVKLNKWLPQQDVLGHPKIKAFITHGGFGSTTEAVYHGVPLVGIPMFGDQQLNMAKSVETGFAVSLEYNELTEDKIVDAVNKILKDNSYKEKVQLLSKLFRDQPDKPLERAVFWTEYVLRHKGASHLRSPARDLSFIQYHSLDVIGVLLAGIFIVLFVTIKIVKFIFRKISGLLFGSGSSKSTSNGSTSAHKKRN